VDECRRCHRQTSLTAGTPFHGLRRLGKALRAFQAFVDGSVSASDLARLVGVSLPTARRWLRRFQAALAALVPVPCWERCEFGAATEVVGGANVRIGVAVQADGSAYLRVLGESAVAERPDVAAAGLVGRALDLLRGVLHDTYRHAVSRKHLQGYLDEVAFRWRCLVAGPPTSREVQALFSYRPRPRAAG
jgi:hypothetical protein